MFEIKYEDINVIDHNNDFWAQRDTQMKLEIIETEKPLVTSDSLKESKKTKKKTKIIKKIEKEYEIVNGQNNTNAQLLVEAINNEIETADPLPIKNETIDEEPIVPVKKTRKLKNKT
jgi:hypothetical protein